MTDAPERTPLSEVKRYGDRLVDAQSQTKASEWRFTECEDGEFVRYSDYAALEQERDRYQRSAEAADWICPGMDGACNRRNVGIQEVCRCGFDRAALTKPEGE